MDSAETHIAVNAAVFKSDGSPVELSSFWQMRPVVITFLRHYGCQFCREFVLTLRQAYPDFVGRGMGVVVIGQGSPAQAQHFSMIYKLPFPILADPQREAYAAWGLGEGAWSDIAHPAVGVRMMQQAARGNFPGIGEHVRGLVGGGVSLKQFGGTFVVDRGGAIRYAHVATPIYKVPAIDELHAALDP